MSTAEDESSSRCCLPELAVRPTVLLFLLPPSPMQTHTHTHTEVRHLSTLHLSTLYNTLINAVTTGTRGGGGKGWLHSVANFSPTCALRYKCRANAPSAKRKYIYTITPRFPSLSPPAFRAILKNN